MKKLILAVVLAASFSANATATKHDGCETIGLFATKVQGYHQSGLALSSILDGVNKTGIRDELKEDLVIVAIMAYERPRWHTESSMQREVEDFHNFVFLSCIKGKLWSY